MPSTAPKCADGARLNAPGYRDDRRRWVATRRPVPARKAACDAGFSSTAAAGLVPGTAKQAECQTLGVEYPAVTRPADPANDQIVPAASRSCVCGHLVYDDQDLLCALCACRDHRPRSSGAREQTNPSSAETRNEEGAS